MMALKERKVRKERKGRRVIGVFPLSNTGGLCVHEIDHADDRVLVSVNGKNPRWHAIKEMPPSKGGADKDTDKENDNDVELGFWFGSFFIPFSQVMRV